MKKSAATRTELDRISHGGHAMHTTGEVMAKIGRNSKELLAAGLVAAGAIGAAPVFGAEANVDDYSHSAQKTVDTALGQLENVAPTDSEQPLPDPNRLAAQEVAGRISHLALRAMGGGTPSAEGQTPTPTGPTSPERGGGEAYTPPESIPNGAHDENSQFFDDLRFAIDQSEAEAAVMGVWDQFSSHGLLRVRVLTESTEGLPLQNEQDGQVLSYSDGKPVMLLDGQIVFAVRLDETTNVHTDNQIVAILEGRDGRLYKGVFQARGNEEFSELLVLVDPNEGHEGDEGVPERVISTSNESLTPSQAERMARSATLDQVRASGEADALFNWPAVQISERRVYDMGDADTWNETKSHYAQQGITMYVETPGAVGEEIKQNINEYADSYPKGLVYVFSPRSMERSKVTNIDLSAIPDVNETVVGHDMSEYQQWLNHMKELYPEFVPEDFEKTMAFFNDERGLKAVRVLEADGSISVYLFATPERGVSDLNATWGFAWAHNGGAKPEHVDVYDIGHSYTQFGDPERPPTPTLTLAVGPSGDLVVIRDVIPEYYNFLMQDPDWQVFAQKYNQ